MGKSNLYENFERIVSEKNMTPYQVAKQTGVATATLTSWKQGLYTPKLDKLIKISDCLDIPLDELIKGRND